MSDYRTEKDSLGEVRVPANALYGAQTQRAKENFPISDLRFPRRFIEALGTVKRAAAQANHALGLLPGPKALAIAEAAGRVADGKLDDQFVLDIFQTGSGTSTNMNANEVIAHVAAEALGDGGPPQRRREHGAVVERRDPDGDARRRPRRHREDR